MRALIFTTLLAIAQFVVAQKKEMNLITLGIDKDSLQYNGLKKSVLIPFTFHNGNDEIIVYGLSGFPHPLPFDLRKLYNTKDTGTGVAFAVYRPDGRQETYQVEIIDHIKKRPMTRERLDSIFRAANERFLKSKRVLLKNETVSVLGEALLADFLLEPGLYYFQLVYYSGENIFNKIGAEEAKRSRSKLFQGCVMSNKVPFVVK